MSKQVLVTFEVSVLVDATDRATLDDCWEFAVPHAARKLRKGGNPTTMVRVTNVSDAKGLKSRKALAKRVAKEGRPLVLRFSPMERLMR